MLVSWEGIRAESSLYRACRLPVRAVQGRNNEVLVRLPHAISLLLRAWLWRPVYSRCVVHSFFLFGGRTSFMMVMICSYTYYLSSWPWRVLQQLLGACMVHTDRAHSRSDY